MMPEEAVQPLNPAELAEIDARYAPFPSFRDWPKEFASSDAWEHSRKEFVEITANATEGDLKEAQAVAMRAAAFDTGAIEGLYSTDRGLTLTVATQAALWEQKVDESGPDARALFEAQLATFELVLDQVTERFPKLTQAWVRRLHEEITVPQDTYKVHTPLGLQEQPLPQGKYKVHPNHVRTGDGEIHAYAPVDQTQAEMQRLIDEIDTPAFREAHPVIQASYTHYALAAIHPFADGNGRVARAVSSAYTYRAASIPLLVLVDRRDAYLAALALADSGDAKSFVEFIGSATQESMELVMDSLLTARAPQPEAELRKFSDLYQGESGYQQLDKVATEFATWLATTAEMQVVGLSLPDTVRVEVVEFKNVHLGKPPHGFRPISEPGGRSIRFSFFSAPPAMAEIDRIVTVFPSKNASASEALRLQVLQTPTEHLALAFRDLYPQPSSAAKHRAENFLRRVLGEGLEALYAEARAGLRDEESR